MKRASDLKRRLRLIVSSALYRLGLLWMLRRLLMRRRAIVLTYHRVLTPEERGRAASHPAMVVDRDVFAMQMAFLKRRFRVLSLQEFVACVASGLPFPDSSCLITFDDGWKDTFENALPILQTLNLPAVVFLPVGYVGGHRVFWQEALTRLLRIAANTAHTDTAVHARLRRTLAQFGIDHLLECERDAIEDGIARVVAARKDADAATTESLVDALARELDTNVEAFSTADGFVTWRQVRLMSGSGIAFGGHGVQHRLLTRVAEAESRAEIEGARDMLRDALGRPVEAFCYPNGYCTETVVEQVRRAGYTLAFTTRRGFFKTGDDPLRIGRLNVHDSVTNTEPMFLARLLGLF